MSTTSAGCISRGCSGWTWGSSSQAIRCRLIPSGVSFDTSARALHRLPTAACAGHDGWDRRCRRVRNSGAWYYRLDIVRIAKTLSGCDSAGRHFAAGAEPASSLGAQKPASSNAASDPHGSQTVLSPLLFAPAHDHSEVDMASG